MPDSLTVFFSFPPPRAISNPYNTLLIDAVAEQPDVVVKTFSWRYALLGRYDLFHVHWPEILVNGRTPLRKAARQILFCLLLVRLRTTRRPLVRTLHNLELPQGISRIEVALLRWAERWTTFWIVINPSNPLPAGTPHAFIPHGHYRDAYGRFPSSPAEPGRVGFFGRIRRYKNAIGLVRAFRAIPDPALRLGIAGEPSSQDLRDELVESCRDDARIEIDLGFLSDEDFVRHGTRCELIVLPYPEMHNSGSVFAALSLDRPVLVPANAVNAALADEVGAGWVLTYEGELEGDDIVAALEAAHRIPPGSRPDLSARDWPQIGAAHVAAYREAVAIARGRGSRA